MRKITFFKTLLVAACLCLGSMSAWADEVFGTTSDEYLAAKSTSITMYDGGTLHYVFTQATRATYNYDGFVVVAENRGGTKLIALRQDNWDNIAASNTGCTNNYNWTGFPSLMNGASVDMTITYNSGTFTMTSTITCSDRKDYSYGYTKSISGSPAAIVVYLSEEAAQITLTTSDYSNSNVVATLDHTASSSRNGSNVITTTVDQSAEHYNNTKAAAWGGWAYAQFSFSIPEGHSVESASLMWSTNIGGNNYSNRDNTIYYLNSGQTIDYGSLTSTTNLDKTGNATSLINVVLTGKTDHKDVVTDVTSAVSAIAASQDYIIFEWTNNAASADLYGKASSFAPVLVIRTSAETLYTATFTESNSLSPSITIYSDSERTSSVTNGTLRDGTEYYYTATLEGYHNYNNSFTVDGTDPSVEFTMTAKTVYNYSVKAVDGESKTIKADIVSGTCYANESTKYYIPACVLKDGTLYFTTSEYNEKTETVESNNQVFSYDYTTSSVDNVVFFVEGEAITGANTSTATNNQRLASEGYMGRGSNLTVTTLPAGSYTIYVHYINTNAGAHTVIVNAGETNVINNTSVSARPTINGSVTLTESATITLTAAGSGTSGVDYLYIVKTGEVGTIPSSGFGTLASAYGLDFSSATGLTDAYVVTKTTTEVAKLASVSELPASSGVILEGTPGASYSIPIKADATYAGTNLLKAAVTATPIAADEAYILQSGEFHLVTAASTVPAGKAYLQAEDVPSGARSLIFVFDDDETTGIADARIQTSSENGLYFDLQGRRVAQPTKGLYIVNGRKVAIK